MLAFGILVKLIQYVSKSICSGLAKYVLRKGLRCSNRIGKMAVILNNRSIFMVLEYPVGIFLDTETQKLKQKPYFVTT